jgi:hypothetical protein
MCIAHVQYTTSTTVCVQYFFFYGMVSPHKEVRMPIARQRKTPPTTVSIEETLKTWIIETSDKINAKTKAFLSFTGFLRLLAQLVHEAKDYIDWKKIKSEQSFKEEVIKGIAAYKVQVDKANRLLKKKPL